MTRTHVRRTLISTLAALAALLPACSTVEGLGQDLQDASTATRDAITGGDEQPKGSTTNDGSTTDKPK